MKIPTMLLERVLHDVGLQLKDTVNLRDAEEIRRRFEHEGMGFLTMTLPSLDDALLRGLSSGRLSRDMFPGFRPRTRSGSLPALLSGFFRLVFNDDGSIKSEPDISAIAAIRQITRLFKKVELPCSDERIRSAYERYQENDREVDWRRHRSPLDAELFASVSGYLWADLEELSGELYCFPGDFGPGATSERFKRNQRLSVGEWPERAEGSFPSSFHAVASEDSDALQEITYLAEETERPVRVVQVPKTLKTPRTISVEPSYMMLMQQSIAKPLMVYLESKRFGFKSIHFKDQSVNKERARLGSMDGSLATIDLKDASDMVDLDLVRHIFSGPCPSFLKLIEDCRSTRAQMPDGTILPLRKFASMGSALCFPIEAMVFFTIIMYALVKKSGQVPSRRLLAKLAADVTVYGDDIIVRTETAPDVVAALEDFGLKVNHNKSFLTGLFRESCGGDYYRGVDVTPTYVRRWDDSGTLSNESLIAAYVSLSNQFYMKGMWHVCQSIRDYLATCGYRFPRSRREIGVLSYTSLLFDTNLRWDQKVYGWRVKGYRIRLPREFDSPSTMDGYLLGSFGARSRSEHLRTFEATVCRDPWRPADEVVQEDLPDAQGAFWEVRHHGFYLLVPGPRLRAGGGAQVSATGVEGSEKDPLYVRSIDLRTSLVAERGLKHLSVQQARSLDTSDRPHALCLKRGWTHHPVGLCFK